ncbi:copper chaperone PCu(A)C [Streptomyces sp. NPDC012623]|uniref:copper chaperone PCu(A)C n=1 Tax=unclassified Streptomyces TaxID=2593676 RepID=UPI0036B72062
MRRAPLALCGGLTAVLVLAATGCSSTSSASSSDASGGSPRLKISGGYMPQPVSDMAAGFLTVTNSGRSADRLTSITSDISDDITIHRTENQRMREVESFDIPAEGELDLERGGNHIMFTHLKKRPVQGQEVGIELHFEKADPIKVELPVKETNHNPATH